MSFKPLFTKSLSAAPERLRNAGFVDARVYLAATLLAAGDRSAASWQAEELRAVKPDFTVQRWLETNPTAEGEFKARLVRSLADLGL